MHNVLITLLAEGPANTGPDFGKASPVGLLVVVLLLIGVFALVWSMNRHLRRVPKSFAEADGPGADGPGADDTVVSDDAVAGRNEATRGADPREQSRESGG
jgi:hypothetical protein